ncbi:MAG: PIN domain-containing protein [Nanoarchaeota archaeon]
MSRYFYDSYSIIELFRGNQEFVKYFSEHEGITAFHNAAEVYYIMLREEGEEKAKAALDFMRKLTTFPDFDILEEAMKFRIKNEFSYADCLGYIMAKRNNLIFLTGDFSFKNFPNVEFIK